MSTPEQRKRYQRKVSRVLLERIVVKGRWVHPDAPHGTLNGYANYLCRCDPCRAVQREYIALLKAERRAERVLVDGRLIHPRAPHGTENAYGNYGCRCEPCTEAFRVAQAGRDERRRARRGGAS